MARCLTLIALQTTTVSRRGQQELVRQGCLQPEFKSNRLRCRGLVLRGSAWPPLAGAIRRRGCLRSKVSDQGEVTKRRVQTLGKATKLESTTLQLLASQRYAGIKEWTAEPTSLRTPCT
ncbi:TPA: hypothetical protein ACH3X3_011283 [Trebouxia sp. C0006]